jgi:hypothetical protein
MMDINAQIAQRLAPQGPVAPQGMRMQSVAERQADINARMGPAAEPMRMRTAEERQADINARTGQAGPQYGGAGLGPVNPVVPAGYIQDGNRLLSPSVYQNMQRQKAAVDPTILAKQDAIAQSGKPQWQQNIAQQQLRDSLARQGVPGFQSTADASASWQARQDDINARRGYTPEQVAALKAQGLEKETVGHGMYNPAALAQLNPYDPKTQYIRSLANTKGVRNAEYMEARRKAEEQYYQERSRRMAQAQSGPGFSLGGLAQAFNPFKGVTRIAEGEGRPQDYLKLATFFL